MDSERPSDIPLTGWKEIASHLRVTVRTAQLWEKQRGLPVHRYPGDGKPRVYALPHELEAWLRDSEAATGPARSESEVRRPRAGVRVAALVLALATATVLWIWTSSRGSSGPLVRCEARERVVSAFDGSNRLIWQQRLEGTDVVMPGDPHSESCVVEDADLDGVPEVYVRYLESDRFARGGTLVRLDDGATVRWKRHFGMPLSRGERKFGAGFRVALVRRVTIGDASRLLVVAKNNPLYPAEVGIVDPGSGETLDRYFHPGAFYDVAFADVDHDGENEALLGGINNPGHGPGRPVLVVLDLPFPGVNGTGRREADFFGNPGPREMAYYVLPRADIDDLTSAKSSVTEVGAPRDGTVALVVHSVDGEVTYAIDLTDLARPVVISAVPSTEFRKTHDRLVAAGRLDHRLGATMPERYFRVRVFDAAPDGNALDPKDDSSSDR